MRPLPELRRRGGRRLSALAVCTLAVGMAWLLVGQQLAGQPVVHLDLAAGLATTSPATSPAHHQTAAHPPTSQQPSPPRPTRPGPAPRTSTARSTAPATAGRAVTFALAQRGRPYRWGAEGPGAYDCSGLVWRGLHQHHHAINPAQLRPGDLLFYARRPHDPASIHHVAIAIGHGRMVEAPAPHIPVHLVPLRWSGFYAAARPVP
jgi:cell wall-associated NlpC family hydrolase